jgi:hypothetical protein
MLAHRYRFTTDGRQMQWTCQRCGAIGGSKTFGSAEDARRYATAFDREDREDMGRRAPLIAGMPLRLLRLLRR